MKGALGGGGAERLRGMFENRDVNSPAANAGATAIIRQERKPGG